MADLWDFFSRPAYADAESINPVGVAYNESRGMTKVQKQTPGPSGEIGTYQLRPIAFQDLQRLNPYYQNKDFFDIAANDETAKKAMMDYMMALQNNYFVPWARRMPTDSELLQMYNVGPTAYKNGVRNPGYIKSYFKGIKGK